jgi:hypothetical protein
MKTKTRKNRKLNRKTRKYRNKKSGAGLFSFGKEVANNIVFDEKEPKNIQNLRQTKEEYNKTYETIVTPDSGKKYTVLFITPQTFLFNNINATRVPTFIINNEIQNLKIKNRFVNYLVKIEDTWYAILRIVFALNTSFFASYTYTIFYKLNKGVIQFNENKNSIKINEKYYDKTKESTLGFFKDKSETLVLKENIYEPITDKSGDIFYALRKFRNVQLESFALKQSAVDTAADSAIDMVF